jgi:hypothetical protein
MRRREFTTLIGGTAARWPLAAQEHATRCPLWVKSRHCSTSAQCPLYSPRSAPKAIAADAARNPTGTRGLRSWSAAEPSRWRATAVGQEITQLQKQLPEFLVLSHILERVDLNSPDGQEIASIIQTLNQSCGEK